ncbi:MAG: asparaginase [Pseudomonadota bacterium]
MNNPRVAVIATGGTISSIGKTPLDIIEYTDNKTRVDTHGLLELFPVVREAAEVVPVPFTLLSSSAIAPSDWLNLHATIHQLVADDPDLAGIVVTHGTATTEETAYFLNLTLKVEQPVVVVGAQRPSSGISTDAAINLYNAIRVAADPGSRGMGTLVMLNDEIQAAREVTKSATLRMQTFKTPDFGVLGHVDAGEVAYYRRPMRTCAPDTEFDVAGLDGLPRVDIVYSYAGSDGTAVDAFVGAGSRGIVSAGLAPGLAPPAETEALARAVREGVVVVQGSRAGSGRVTQRASLSEKGLIAGDNLNPQKARVLLMLALTRSQEAEEIARMFGEY